MSTSDKAARIGVGESGLDPEIAARLKRNPDGLIAAIAQQHDTGEVLMLGWMDDEALHRTLITRRCTYWSRSRQEYWVKGETSGHAQTVKSVALDCDGDVVELGCEQRAQPILEHLLVDVTEQRALHGEPGPDGG
jgi:phosphoribosyl-AMP cyclohydrolase